MAKNNAAKEPEGIETIAENRRARYDYEIGDTFEAGMELRGSEVKSLRARHVNFGDTYAIVKNGEVFLVGLKIEAYKEATHEQHEVDRTRRLLLHTEEIRRLQRAVEHKGCTLVPLKLYFKKGWAKVRLGIAKGKTKGDRREDVKRREADREVARALRRGG